MLLLWGDSQRFMPKSYTTSGTMVGTSKVKGNNDIEEPIGLACAKIEFSEKDTLLAAISKIGEENGNRAAVNPLFALP